MTHRPAYRNPAVWKLGLVLCAVMALLNSISSVIGVVFGSRRVPAWEPAVIEFTSWAAFALLVPFVVTFALRFRVRRSTILPWVFAQICSAAVFSVLHVTGMVLLRQAAFELAGTPYRFGDPLQSWLYEVPKDVIVYGLILGVCYGIDIYLRYRRRELSATQLEASLANARLEALKQQIQPHFLFNTLNMISSTMHDDLERADHMIMRLSDLLRLTVAHHRAQEVPMATELDLLDAYREIMRARFEDRLRIEIEAEPDCMEALVPPLLLQPLVENAIKHGLAARARGGTIRVRIVREADRVLCTVSDDGVGTTYSLEQLLQRGVGLSATVERLDSLYESQHGFDVARPEGGGFEVRMSLPYRPSTASIASGV